MIPLQNDTQALKIIFPAAENDWAKMPEKSKKNKTNLQHSISLHIALPQIIALQKDTQALKIMFPATQND